MPKVVVYTAVPCGYCRAAIRYLREVKKVEVEVIDLTGSHQDRMALKERTGRRTIPQIFIDEHHVGGYDDMRALDASGGLDSLLECQT
jgi:glutaredoxin 3